MASNIEVDLMLKRAIRLLHSPSSNSATELRQMLDEAIKQRYGAEKLLCKTLTKTHLEEEKTFPGRMATPPPQQLPQDEEIINLTHSPTKSESPDTIMDSDEGGASNSGPIITNTGQLILTTTDEDINLKEFGDLNCCVCAEMMFTATNRLIECSTCGALYHQDCHKPPISNEEASEDREHLWQCATCDRPSTSKSPTNSSADIVVIPDDIVASVATSNKTIKSTSSSSSNSSSPFYKQDSTISKHHHRSISGANAREEQRSTTKSSTAASINVISGSERSAVTSKRSSHSSSTSKSSRSRHSESTSSRRKSTK